MIYLIPASIIFLICAVLFVKYILICNHVWLTTIEGTSEDMQECVWCGSERWIEHYHA